MLREKNKIEERRTLWCLMGLMALGYVLIHDLLGGTLLSHSGWDSYTLQALAWLRGDMDLGQNYDYLELAIYQGKYFVSFPPFPSVVMLPFALIFGVNTPNNLIIAVITMCIAALVYSLSLRARFKPFDAALIALSITWGSNLMWMSTNGGVWFMAQSLNMLLLLLASDSAQKGRRAAAYLCVALAVGCRPFSAFMFLPLFVYFYMNDREKGRGAVRTALWQWKAWLPVAGVAAVLMWYNYARFGSVLEFGHNYLPEFIEAPKGQFDPSYIGVNLFNIWLRPVKLGAGLSLDYTFFDGFMFYVANPFFLLFFASQIRDMLKKRISTVRVALVAAFMLDMLALCAHKTFGGWQFGARYTVDMLPAALALVLLSASECGESPSLRTWEKVVIGFGTAFNIYGALAMNILT